MRSILIELIQELVDRRKRIDEYQDREGEDDVTSLLIGVWLEQRKSILDTILDTIAECYCSESNLSGSKMKEEVENFKMFMEEGAYFFQELKNLEKSRARKKHN